jgi:type I restriction-modification system DNA methylase subunit
MIGYMACPDSVRLLVDRFEKHRDDYTSGKYNETQLRREFLDPLFEALGWDVSNRNGYAEAYKEVIHEDAVKINGSTKAPDYSFRIGGTRKFFVEAKKPAVNVKDDAAPALQLRRYAWSAKLPLGIVSDFEEFAIYDTRVRPSKNDRATAARVALYSFKDYLTRWDEIAAIFSKESILNGAFDRFADASSSKKGTTEVDEAFLKEIETWRASLARAIANRNPDLTQQELNFAVQRTIDRIVFLRICEDRGIEKYGRLKDAVLEGPVYQNLVALFREADEKYDSGLFHFQKEKEDSEPPDTLTPRIAIDDKPLKEIIVNLYYPESPYEFSVVSADILGYVYEQFLGKVIRLTADHHAKIEDKPEVKKAHGVYYTPTFIVDFIVRRTLGPLVDGKTAKQVAKLKVVDPACGSGAFLIGAYQFLLDWYREWYVKDGAEKHANSKSPALYRNAVGEWRLTTAERKRILLDNIFGVDIDPQAVEVTKLSLLLKVLEGESHETLRQLKLFHERALPYLGRNIKCGNSLIGPDFYAVEGASELSVEQKVKINAFDWGLEFGSVAGAAGFDAVIGNPPYVRMEEFKEVKSYLKRKYTSHEERADLYVYFVEKGHNLLKKNGRFGIIVSNKFLRAKYGKPLRDFIADNAIVDTVVDFAGLPVFKHATVRTIVLLTTKGTRKKYSFEYVAPITVEKFGEVEHSLLSVEQAIDKSGVAIDSDSLKNSVWSFAGADTEELMGKIGQNSILLQEYCAGKICMGIKSGLTGAFVIDRGTHDKLVAQSKASAEILKPFLNGRDIRRYLIEPKDLYLVYTYHGIDIKKYPAVEDHLRPFKDKLIKRATKQEWYELQQPQKKFSDYLEGPKIVFPDIATEPRFAMDEKGYYGSNTMYFIPVVDYYLLALLNSRLGAFYFKQVCAGLEGKSETYLRFFGQYLEGFPVHEIEHGESGDKDKLTGLAKRISALQKELSLLRTDHEKDAIRRQIEAADKEINDTVYRLYKVSETEISLIEGSGKSD